MTSTPQAARGWLELEGKVCVVTGAVQSFALRQGSVHDLEPLPGALATSTISSTSDRHQAGPHVDRTPSDDSAVKFSR